MAQRNFNLKTGEAPPPQVREILASILHFGLMDIRGQAHAGNAARCHRQSDHLHNLPSLLNNYSPEMLDFYWSVTRATYIQDAQENELQLFAPLWEQLEPFVPSLQREKVLELAA